MYDANSTTANQQQQMAASDRHSMVDTNNTNFINQLVENWVPNMSGTYTPFGESPLPPQNMSSSTQSSTLQQMNTHNSPTVAQQINNNAATCDIRSNDNLSQNQRSSPLNVSTSSSSSLQHNNQINSSGNSSNNNNNSTTTTTAINSIANNNCANINSNSNNNNNAGNINGINNNIINNQLSSDSLETAVNCQLNSAQSSNVQTARTNGSFQTDNTIKANISLDVKKPIRFHENRRMHEPRMIAEVKPMRMSYSDVLSKNVFINNLSNDSNAYNNANTTATLPNGGTQNVNPSSQKSSSKLDKTKNAFNATSEKTKSINHNDDINKEYAAKTTKSAAFNNLIQNAVNAKNLPTSPDADLNRDAKATMDADGKPQAKKGKTATNMTNGKSSVNSRPVKNSSSTEFLTKRRSQSDLHSSAQQSTNVAKDESDKSSQNTGFFYNITKNESLQPEKMSTNATKPTQRKSASSKSSFSSASISSSSSSSTNRSGSARIEKSNNAYQQKRIQKTRKNNTYALAMKFVKAWFNYMLLFFKWLIALVCDVFLLSFGIIWDRISAGFDYVCQLCVSVRTELTNNSGRPSVYFTSLWQRFDNRFGKDSKWAIWRRIFAKKKPPEPTVPDYYKNGRLPQTGEEAMYSLLNCKGKDAYR